MTNLFVEAQNFLIRVEKEIKEKANNYGALPRIEFYADGSGQVTIWSEEERFTWLAFDNPVELLQIVRGEPNIPWDDLPVYKTTHY